MTTTEEKPKEQTTKQLIKEEKESFLKDLSDFSTSFQACQNKIQSYRQEMEGANKIEKDSKKDLRSLSYELKRLQYVLQKLKNSKALSKEEYENFKIDLTNNRSYIRVLGSELPNKTNTFLLLFVFNNEGIGAKIKWIKHHALVDCAPFSCIFFSGFILFWPFESFLNIFASKFYIFSIYVSFTQLSLHYFQVKWLYKLRALGNASIEDTVNCDTPVTHFTPRFRIQLPFTIAQNLFMLYLSFYLIKSFILIKESPNHCLISGLLLFALVIGNSISCVKNILNSLKTRSLKKPTNKISNLSWLIAKKIQELQNKSDDSDNSKKGSSSKHEGDNANDNLKKKENINIESKTTEVIEIDNNNKEKSGSSNNQQNNENQEEVIDIVIEKEMEKEKEKEKEKGKEKEKEKERDVEREREKEKVKEIEMVEKEKKTEEKKEK